MCGRYYNRREKQEIAERMKAGKVFEEPFAPDYNIAPTTFQPVLRLERDSGERELAFMRWGLVPFFAKSLQGFKGFSTFNARSETLAKAPIWREPFKKRRCLVPADGFYEWQTHHPPVGSKAKPIKTPFAITITNGEPMAFAGVWDAWRDKDLGAWLQSFAIITTEGNEIMDPVHDRMPVILHQRDWAEWLDRDQDRPAPTHLLRPFDSDEMKLSPCNQAVGNVKNNGPGMLNSA